MPVPGHPMLSDRRTIVVVVDEAHRVCLDLCDLSVPDRPQGPPWRSAIDTSANPMRCAKVIGFTYVRGRISGWAGGWNPYPAAAHRSRHPGGSHPPFGNDGCCWCTAMAQRTNNSSDQCDCNVHETGPASELPCT